MPVAFWIFFTLLFLFILGTGSCYLWISIVATPYLYDDISSLPYRKTALLLGTAKFTRHGQVNLFFTRRIAKAMEAYNQHKTGSILISGADKQPGTTDEVDHMYETLQSLGVPAGLLLKDHRGSRTWNSMWRCRHVYQTMDPLIISQRFHNQRAVFIGLRMGMAPIAINASGIRGKTGVWMFLRECLARVKCLMDCYWLKPQPDAEK